MSEQQLERSVLEGKEREELFAIAEALGTRPTSRAKKADLVTAILRATGVEAPADEPERPRRTRTRRVAAAPDAAEPQGQLEIPTDGPLAEVTAAGDEPASESPEAGTGPDAEPAGPDVPAGVSPAGARAAGRREEEGDDEAAVGGRGVSNPAAVNGNGVGGVGTDTGRPVRNVARGGSPSGGGRPQQGISARPNGAHSASGSPAGSSGGGPGSSGSSAGAPGSSGSSGAGSGSSGSSGAGSGSSGSSGAGSGSSQHAGVDSDGDGQRFENEGGGRRNRRRRGRDRNDRPERELQGQASEAQYTGEPIPVSGLLDLRDEGYGFLRTTGFIPGHEDVYVSISQVRRFSLRKGDFLEGGARPAGNNEKYPALLRIDTVSGLSPDEARNRPRFDSLTPLFPDQKLALEVPGDSANTTARIVDLISPIGKGQRGLIVSPPKAGKTTILKQIAHSIEANNPDVYLMVLLVDERPEEVTDMRRSVKGEVVASTFDRPSEEHTQVAELAIERAKRMVEQGRDVVIVLDGITRLARAYNLAQPATGRVMSGGIDTGALYPPKKFFGAARNIEEGGSLTILATALVETGSKMDEVIFEEFKGTGNMELRLDRRLAERRIYPAIDVNGSSTRHEELLFSRTQLQQVWKLRRALNALAAEGSSAASLELLMDKIKATRSNDEFLAELAKNPATAV
ncbi:transcription termination factor Rho [Acidiferrimicrobium sp. IK]|uniref:transcription termination factor Rho n=1 Tax=Acidiferrimicrobium sp. IK TaxID=2871700 RepID=UPI0021CB7035|nr:transcription termination factor Rho [Acidiferrimicrobium sp. IK]MCU4186477.1 transcription termination factor Rho [Acidiferrimicrobium sp. IK]